MKPSKYKILFFLFLSVKVFSQNFLGISSGNYAGTNALTLNPAHVSDSRYQFYVHLAGAGVDLQNNYVKWSAPFSFIAMATGTYDSQYRAPSGDLQWQNSYTEIKSLSRTARMFLNVEGRGPAIQFNSQRFKAGIAVGVRYRFLTSLTKASGSIGEAIALGLKVPNNRLSLREDNEFSLNNGLYNEFFITLGKVLKEDDERFFKAGITIKRLVSDFSTNVTGNNVDFMLSRIPSTWRPGMARTVIDLPQTQGSFSNVSTGSFGIRNLMSLNGVGTGFGLDLGVVYEHRPDARKYEFTHNGRRVSDPTKNKYKYRIGFSLMDIGYLKYSDQNMVNVAQINSTNNTIGPDDFYQLEGTQGFVRSIQNVYRLDPNDFEHEYTVLYPATAVTSFDYAYSEKIFVSTVWRQSLLPSFRRGVIGQSAISVIPRYETKWWEVAVPLSLDNNYSNLNLGVAFRAGPLYIGSDNFLGIVNIGKPRGISAYAGLFLPLNARLPDSPLKCYFDEDYRKAGGKKKKNLRIFRK